MENLQLITHAYILMILHKAAEKAPDLTQSRLKNVNRNGNTCCSSSLNDLMAKLRVRARESELAVTSKPQ